MSVATVRVPFQKDLLQQIDKFVVKNVRSRTDIICEATKMYVERKQNWQNIFLFGEQIAADNHLSENDVMDEIKDYRRNK